MSTLETNLIQPASGTTLTLGASGDTITIPTPWNEFNELLQGGLGNGDFGLIFGNPGGGKSWALIALGANAVSMGYNVIHYTLELGEEYVGRRYDAYFTKIPVNLIIPNKEKVADATKNLPGNLIIREYSPGKASISTVESHIKKCIDLDFKINEDQYEMEVASL